jgi:hypothetical protein
MENTGIMKFFTTSFLAFLGLWITASAQVAPHNLVFWDTGVYPDQLKNEQLESGFMDFPVELIGFHGCQIEQHVILEWETGNEVCNQGFYVERRNDSHEWEEIGFIAGEGTSVTVQTYLFVDFHPLEGVQHYRLRQVDEDGSFTYSTAICVVFGSPHPFAKGPVPMM